jgi:hypothetical protein
MADSVPEIVYHYTDQNGLLGILEKKELWCTHMAYMNDATEYEFGATLLREMLVLLESDGPDERIRDHAQTAKYYAGYQRKPVTEQTNQMLPWGPCVASFSAMKDDLSQWRAYSRTGSRFAFGFRTAKLRKLPETQFKNVEYCRERALQNLSEAFISGVRRIDEAPHAKGLPTSRIHPPEYTLLLQRLLREIGVYCKHCKFRDEREWRLALDAGKPAFRSGRSFVIPYTTVSLKELDHPIESITVGPCAHPELSISSVLQLLLSNHWQQGTADNVVRVIKSKVPYRDW